MISACLLLLKRILHFESILKGFHHILKCIGLWVLLTAKIYYLVNIVLVSISTIVIFSESKKNEGASSSICPDNKIEYVISDLSIKFIVHFNLCAKAVWDIGKSKVQVFSSLFAFYNRKGE